MNILSYKVYDKNGEFVISKNIICINRTRKQLKEKVDLSIKEAAKKKRKYIVLFGRKISLNKLNIEIYSEAEFPFKK